MSTSKPQQNESVESILPPSVLYLYLSEPTGKNGTEDVLANTRFKLSRVGSLNDPFDFIPVVNKMSHSEIAIYINRRFPGQPEKLRRRYAKAFEARYREIIKNPRNEWARMSRDVRLLCFSQCNNGVLLWSHYASRHRGFAIGLNVRGFASASPHATFEKVHYTNDRPQFSMLDFVGDEDVLYGNYRRLFCRKSIEWNYEQEWRGTLGTSQIPNSDYLSFHPSLIDSIILGSEMPEGAEAILKSAFASGNIPHKTSILRAVLSNKHFKIYLKSSNWRV